MDNKFENLSFDKKCELLNINESTFTLPKNKNVPKEVVVNDSWNGSTNAQKRNMLKNIS